MKYLGAAMVATSVLISLGVLWFWALFGLSEPIGIASAMTSIGLLTCGAFLSLGFYND